MKRWKLVAAMVACATTGMFVGARYLLSSEVDPGGVSRLVSHLIETVGTEAGVETSVTRHALEKVPGYVDRAIGTIRNLHRILQEIDKDRTMEGHEAEVTAHLAEIQKEIVSLVDLKDLAVREAGEALPARARAEALVRVVRHVRARTGLDPAAVESIIAGLRQARQAGTRAYLGLDEARAAELAAVLDRYAGERQGLRASRRAVIADLETALADGSSDEVVGRHMATWATLNARGSELAREQIGELNQRLTLAEKLKLAARARQRMDRALKVLALIARFQPVKG